MITYITMTNFAKTASSLDDVRLGLQREQALAVLDQLTGLESEVPESHPVINMWLGFEYALCIYGQLICMEWTRRGFEDKVFWKFHEAIEDLGGYYEAPPWMRDKDLCRSHRSNLMRRWPRFYAEQWAGTPENMPYLWPVVRFKGDSGNWVPSSYDLIVSKDDKKHLKKGERELPKRIAERVANL